MTDYRLRYTLFGLLLLAFAGLTGMAQRAVVAAAPSLAEIESELLLLEDGVRFSAEKQATLTIDAIPNAVSAPTVELAHEFIALQNAFVSGQPVSLADYPLADAFFRQAAAQAGGSAPLAEPCGSFSNPIPNQTPPRILFGPFDDPATALIDFGFHYTQGYACGETGDECSSDFTYGRAFSSSAGFCAAPRFRAHGRLDPLPGYVNVQRAEPNPEVLDYEWPYWFWGTYVLWWHATY